MATKPTAFLRVIEGVQQGQSFPLTCRIGDVCTLGRALDNTICLKDTEVSRRHATLTFDGSCFTLADNRSTNGSYVNGAFTARAVLGSGDQIRLGDTVLRFENPEPEPDKTSVMSDSLRVFADDPAGSSTPNVNMTLSVHEGALLVSHTDRHNLDQLRAAHEQLSILHEVNQAVASAVDQQQMLETIMDQLAKLKDFDRGFVFIFDDAHELQVRAFHRGSGAVDDEELAVVSRTVLDQVVKEGVAVLCSDLHNDPRFGAAESVRLANIRSAICVPLIANAEVLGVLHLDSQSLHNAFTEHDLRLFTTIANDIAISLANQRMRDRLVERQRIEHELEIASQIQQNFLPTHVPANSRIALCARNIPALQVGGDFYDYFNLGDERFGLVIGDVSGKGVPAALLMMRAMTEFRSRAMECRESTADAVAALNTALAAKSMRGMFITLVYLVIDTKRSVVQYTNAGHLPPLLIHPDGTTEQLKDAHSMPVGIMPGAEFQEATMASVPGDMIFLTTDGMTEARNGARDEMTEARVNAAAQRNAGSPEALVAAVFRETVAFVGAAAPHDDLTAVAVQIS